MSGQAFVLNGTNQYVQLTDNPNLYPGTASFSIEAWVNTTSTVPFQMILRLYECGGVSCGPGAATLYDIDPQSGKPDFLIRDAANVAQQLTAASSVADGFWHQIVGTRDTSASTFNLYVDGVFAATAGLTANAPSTVRMGTSIRC